MEQLIAEIEAYAAAVGKNPRLVLRDAAGCSWREWDRWVSGQSSPRLSTVDRIRAYMAANPPTENAA